MKFFKILKKILKIFLKIFLWLLLLLIVLIIFFNNRLFTIYDNNKISLDTWKQVEIKYQVYYNLKSSEFKSNKFINWKLIETTNTNIYIIIKTILNYISIPLT